ncbi:MAG TPA: LysR substrate-binding domain-containing protein [Moraxellaceae bacterium]|nr:LysR substrate-binding domain-containing protein [Moraxellaceae bacterium]
MNSIHHPVIDLRHLRTLATLREAGSLAEAAERLHLTQSALSHQLKSLEADTGLTLYVRKSQPPRFTRAGERLLALADLVLPALREAARDLVRLRDGRSGRLVMAIECHSCFEWLMPALNRFRQDWPEVELDFTSGFHADAQDLLRRRELDLVVTSNPGPDPSLRFVPLFDYEARLVVGLQHPLASRDHVVPGDLADQTLITYPVDEERLDVFAHFLTPAGIRPAALRHSELTLMMVQLAASGRGVCALPGWAAQEFEQRGWIRTLPLGAHGTWRTLYAAIREEDADLAFLQDFLLTARTTSEATLAGIRPAVFGSKQ